MTINEFLYEFNIGWNNNMSNQAPGLTPYEISVFLTQAQEAIVKGIYNGTLTNSFESTEEARSYLTPLVIQGYPCKLNDQAYSHITKGTLLYNLDEVCKYASLSIYYSNCHLINYCFFNNEK